MKKNIAINFELFIDILDLEQEDQLLIQKAMDISKSAQATYSKFRVGAAALLSDGRSFVGFNIENAAYPQCLCAEQVMISNVKTQIAHAFIKKVVVFSPDSKGDAPLSPCGSCRQIMREQEFLQQQNIELIMMNSKGEIWVFDSISDLLPLSFDSDNM